MKAKLLLLIKSCTLEVGEPPTSFESSVARVDYTVYELGQSGNYFFLDYFRALSNSDFGSDSDFDNFG